MPIYSASPGQSQILHNPLFFLTALRLTAIQPSHFPPPCTAPLCLLLQGLSAPEASSLYLKFCTFSPFPRFFYKLTQATPLSLSLLLGFQWARLYWTHS